MLFNEVSRDERKVVVFVFLLHLFLLLLFVRVFSLHFSIKVNEILVNSLLSERVSLFFKLFQLFDMSQELLFLFSLHVLVQLRVLHLLSHLSEVLLHNLIVGCFSFIVDFLSELDHISRVNFFLVICVTHLSHSLELSTVGLWVWISHMEAFLLRRRLTVCSCLGNGGGHNRHIFLVLRPHHNLRIVRASIACKSWVPMEGLVHFFTVFSERLPAHHTVLRDQLSDFKHESDVLSLS